MKILGISFGTKMEIMTQCVKLHLKVPKKQGLK